MAPEGLQLFLRAGVFIALVSLFMVFLIPRESAEFVVSVCSLGVGITLIVLVIVVNRWTR